MILCPIDLSQNLHPPLLLLLCPTSHAALTLHMFSRSEKYIAEQ